MLCFTVNFVLLLWYSSTLDSSTHSSLLRYQQLPSSSPRAAVEENPEHLAVTNQQNRPGWNTNVPESDGCSSHPTAEDQEKKKRLGFHVVLRTNRRGIRRGVRICRTFSLNVLPWFWVHSFGWILFVVTDYWMVYLTAITGFTALITFFKVRTHLRRAVLLPDLSFFHKSQRPNKWKKMRSRKRTNQTKQNDHK